MLPGAVLLGKYRVDEVLGTGGMGKVVRAWHLMLEQSVAIKVLLPHVADSEATVARFMREAQATVRLRSEHIARVMDVGTLTDGTPLMVMEFLEGDDLNQIVRAHGPQEPHVVVDLMLQACEGIAEAHAAGIVHRDIKPSNFFITKRPDGSQLLKILDFGISKSPVGWSDLTGTQTVVGTPSYMSPEQMKAARNADSRSDVWSMGIVIYQLLAGRPPFVGESYAEMVLKVGSEPPAPLHVALPGGLADVIWRCLEKDPDLRIQSVSELAKLLAPYASDPAGGAAAAERAQRILAVRPSQPAGRMRAEGGAMPAPLTPSWQRAGGSSVSHVSGQVTYQTTGRKGWLVAGAVSLVIVAGVGGWLANDVMRTPQPQPQRSSPSPSPMLPAATVPAVPAAVPAATATARIPARPDAAVPAATATISAPPDAGVAPDAPLPIDAATATATATDAATAIDAGSPTKPVVVPRPRPKPSDDLFDSRH